MVARTLNDLWSRFLVGPAPFFPVNILSVSQNRSKGHLEPEVLGSNPSLVSLLCDLKQLSAPCGGGIERNELCLLA